MSTVNDAVLVVEDEAALREAEMNGRIATARRLTSSRPGNVDPCRPLRSSSE